MDKKKVGIAVGCAAVAAVIAICAVTFGGKKGDAAEPAATVETAATAEPAAMSAQAAFLFPRLSRGIRALSLDAVLS